jgi:hypothetical protein
VTDDDSTTKNAPAAVPFRMVGESGGPACAGDACELPAPASVDVEQLNP